MIPKPGKKRKKISIVRLYLVTGLFLLLAILAGPRIYRFGVLLVKSGFSVSEAEQYHNLKNFGVSIPTGYRVHGIDVSHHQGRINWPEVAAMNVDGVGFSFVFIKATEGITRQDSQFERNWKDAGKAGMIRGAYHFFYASRDAGKQAQNFIDQVKLRKGDLPPVLDIEKSNGKPKKVVVDRALEWCLLIEKHYGVKPIIYTSPGFYNKYLADDFDEYPLWIAHYYQALPRISHRKWQFWQHNDQARINGIKGGVDVNVFNGNPARLKKLCVE